MTIVKMTDLYLKNKRVFIRSDMNVPIKNGKITSDARIRYSLPTIEIALQQGARVMVATHLGRPIENIYRSELSLKPIADYLQSKLSYPVRLVKNYLNGIKIAEKELTILENVRFNKGEKDNEEFLAKKYAALCDVFVMDAFGAAHNVHASTYGISMFAPIACAGLLLSSELKTLSKVLNNPSRPMIAIVGGSKISTKLSVLNSLSKIADHVIVGGGIANTFIAAQGYNIGKSIYEANLIPEAKRILENNNIQVPTDVQVANTFSENANVTTRMTKNIKENEHILDIGNDFASKIAKIIANAKTILWNGPVGVFEFANSRRGTEVIANTIANSKAFSIAGGGDTLAAIEMFRITNQISYISTGGGAFLKFVEDKKLPAVAILENRAKQQLAKYTDA